MSWAADLNRLADKGKHDLGELAKAVKIQLFGQVTRLTRVDTGRLRGNWQVNENAPSGKPIDRLDPSGNAVMSEIKSKASENGKTYLTNHLPYAKVYEEKDAMVGRSVVLVRKAVKDEIKRLRG